MPEMPISMMLPLRLLFLSAFCASWRGSLASDSTTLQDLHKRLMDNSNPSVRPGSPNSRVEVDLSVELQWADMSADGVVTAGLWREMRWEDQRMQWSRRQFRGAKKMLVDAADIWTPDVALLNRRDVGRLMRPCRVRGHCGDAVVSHDGTVTLTVDEVVQFKCKEYFDRRRSIWDQFNCFLEYSFWYSGRDGLKFSSRESKPKKGTNFEASSLEISGQLGVEREGDNRLTFRLPLRRKFTVQRNEQIFWNPLTKTG